MLYPSKLQALSCLYRNRAVFARATGVLESIAHDREIHCCEIARRSVGRH